MLIPSKRWRHFAAMVLIGDGVMALVYPELDAEAWKVGPKPWRCLMQGLHDHPTLTRAIGAAEIVTGICWALYQTEESKLISATDNSAKLNDE